MNKISVPREHLLPLGLISEESLFKTETRLCKLIFLAQEEFLEDRIYEFYAYSYGPRSDELLAALDSLEANGLININEARNRISYEITERGERLLNEADDYKELDASKSVYEKYGTLRVREILDYVYESYNEWVKHSMYEP